MSYWECHDTTDKIIHLLYAGYMCDYYADVIKELEEQYGKETVDRVKSIFESYYIGGSHYES